LVAGGGACAQAPAPANSLFGPRAWGLVARGAEQAAHEQSFEVPEKVSELHPAAAALLLQRPENREREKKNQQKEEEEQEEQTKEKLKK
jgi:hypothetical protein